MSDVFKMTQKVMKAPNEQCKFTRWSICYPMMASVKFDGFRCVVSRAGFHSSSVKPQANIMLPHHFRELSEVCINERVVFDGELYSPSMTFNELSGRLRRRADSLPADLKFHCFDSVAEQGWVRYSCRESADKRWDRYAALLSGVDNAVVIPQRLVQTAVEAEAMFKDMIAAGEEGIMLRRPNSPYKHGRATLDEGYLYKFKEWVTTDAKIVGFKRGTRMSKEYERSRRTRDVVGDMERTTAKSTRVETDEIGSFQVEIIDGQHYPMGTKCYVTLAKGFYPKEPVPRWKDRDKWLYRHVEIRFQKHGSKDKPRMGAIKRWRKDLD